LKKIERVEIWAEGALGKVHLEIESMTLAPKSEQLGQPITQSDVRPSPAYDQCQDGVQDGLKFGISTRKCGGGSLTCETEDMPLAESVCCDSRNLALAEPQFTFDAPDINFFSKLDIS